MHFHSGSELQCLTGVCVPDMGPKQEPQQSEVSSISQVEIKNYTLTFHCHTCDPINVSGGAAYFLLPAVDAAWIRPSENTHHVVESRTPAVCHGNVPHSECVESAGAPCLWLLVAEAPPSHHTKVILCLQTLATTRLSEHKRQVTLLLSAVR